LSWIANPAGGVMSGDGVSGNWFFPGDALVGDNVVTYTFVNEFNCSSSASDVINIDDCTGINEVNNEQISIYPNPASDIIRILNAGIGVKEMTIFNAHGEVVLKNNQSNSREIEIGSLSNGVYHLELLLQDGSRQVERFVKI
jgi:Secretion system C-terminal sorting domain